MSLAAVTDNAIWFTDEELAVATPEERARYDRYLRGRLYAIDPVTWGRDTLHETWWSMQKRIAAAVRDHRKVAVRSCHEAGKDFIAARIACWWIATHTPGAAAVVSTAASHTQVKAVLWKEINQAHKKGGLPGRTNLTEWYINGEVVGIGRKVADYNPTAMQGIHAPEGVLVIFDEACGINEELFQAGNSMAGNDASRQLAIGNPDDPGSYFAKLFKPESDWHQIHIDGYATPNFTDEELPADIKTSLLQHAYVDGLLREYGEDSPIFISKVRGNFPDDAKDGVVPWSKLTQCRYVEPRLTGAHDLGVDVAASEEGDGDATIIRERHGNKAGKEWELHTSDSERIVGVVVQALQETGAERVKVDSIGVGFGVIGHLRALRKEGVHDAKVIGVNVSERSTNPARFPNLRSQIWWEVAREATLAGEWCMAGADDKTLADLIGPRYSINARGQIVIEPKADTKKRTGRSPDKADALNLAFYEPAGAGPGRTFGKQIAQARLS